MYSLSRVGEQRVNLLHGRAEDNRCGRADSWLVDLVDSVHGRPGKAALGEVRTAQRCDYAAGEAQARKAAAQEAPGVAARVVLSALENWPRRQSCSQKRATRRSITTSSSSNSRLSANISTTCRPKGSPARTFRHGCSNRVRIGNGRRRRGIAIGMPSPSSFARRLKIICSRPIPPRW